jgi:hypothetical protein
MSICSMSSVPRFPDPAAFENRHVGTVVAPGEHGSVDPRVQRLHAPAEQGRRAGDLLHRAGVDALRLQRRPGSVGRDDVPPELAQSARERNEAVQVRN